MYDDKFRDSAVKKYAANLIVMNTLSQVDSDGHNLKTLDGIWDYNRDDSDVSKVNAFITTNRGVIKIRQTRIGYKFIIQWKDDTTTWMQLKIMK